MEFAFDQKKNDLRRRQRGVTFPQVIEAIAERGVLVDFEHPNQEKYPGQRVMVVDIEGYAFCVPYEIQGETWHLKTLYPSRRFKQLLKGDRDASL
jgi:uncharacterized DUF497 family protein